jgi:hypothetical protein
MANHDNPVGELDDRPVVFTGQPSCPPELPTEGETSMASKKKTPSKKGKLRDLPKSKKKLTSDQAKAVKGGAADYFLNLSGTKGAQ